MTATAFPPPPAPAPAAAPCAACGAPLRPAAGYCLGCGARQGEARADLVDLVVPSAPAVPAADEVAPATVLAPRAGAAGTWPFALTAVVLVALVVGLVAGRLLADGRGAPVVRVEGVTTAAPVADAPPTAAPAAATAATPAGR